MFKVLEIGIIVVFVEYFLKKLVLGGFYKVDVNLYDQNFCLCGCNVKFNFLLIGMGMIFIMSFIF